jgi:hypothetical protein
VRTSRSVRARRRICQAALGVGAAAAIIAGTSASAFAAPSPSATQSASKTEGPDADVYWAYSFAKAPYQNVSGGSIYAENTLEATSVPPPESCQIGVELRYASNIALNILESKYSGYKSCPSLLNTSVVTPAFKCRASPGKTNFYATGIADIITPAGNSSSATQDSSTTSLYCEV